MFRWLRVQTSHRIVLRCIVVYPVPVTVVVRLLSTLTSRPPCRAPACSTERLADCLFHEENFASRLV